MKLRDVPSIVTGTFFIFLFVFFKYTFYFFPGPMVVTASTLPSL